MAGLRREDIRQREPADASSVFIYSKINLSHHHFSHMGSCLSRLQRAPTVETSSNTINTSSMATITGVTGKQYLPSSKDYVDAKYQYATSTHQVDHNMNPGLIVQPSGKDDILATLQYARANKLAVATRTGGHQYSGASSTAAPNIQLDLSKTFRGPDDRHIFEKDGQTFVRTSVSWSLGAFNEYLGQNKLFIPHGQCTDVFIGGHVQTGGYGQLGRSFGLFGDHVISLEIITYDGSIKEVTKASDPDHFFALLGGSPGNLGVLTHFTVQVHRDSDYLGSRGLKVLHWYSPENVKRLLNVLTEMSDNPSFPRNYDLCISVLSSSFPLLDLWPELDGKMQRDHPEIYGKNGLPFWPRTIIVYAQWVPFSKTDVCDMSWFKRLNDHCIFTPGVQEKPMSELTKEWIFRNRREFEHPYVKRTYASDSSTLTKNGWVNWVAGRIDKVVKPDHNGLWLSAQLQCFGGQNSKTTTNAGNGTAYSWRDSTLVATLDCFHDEEHKQQAEEWAKTNDEEGLGASGKFSKQDRRLLWGSYGDFNLDNVWNTYYENREKYEKIGKVRARVDPEGTFTPNPFAVKRVV